MSMSGWEYLTWQGRQWIRQARLPVVLAGSLTVMAVLLAMVCLQQQMVLQESMQSQSLVKRPVAIPAKDQGVAGKEELEAFYDRLPLVQHVLRIIQDIHGTGEKLGVAVSKGVYKIDKGGEGRILRVTLRFPLEGRSGKLEPFIWEVMKKYPSLSLEAVTFQRITSLESEGNAEIRFVLFTRADVANAEELLGKASARMILK